MSRILRLLVPTVLLIVGFPVHSARAELDPQMQISVEKAVVQIAGRIVLTDKDGKRGKYPPVPLGSGTFVSADGRILTNHHVIDQTALSAVVEANQQRLRSQGEEVTLKVQTGRYLILFSEHDEAPTVRYTAELIADDEDLDLAVLQIIGGPSGQPLSDPDIQFPFVEMGDSDGVQKGDAVYVFGYPSTTTSLALTNGSVSSFEVDDAGGEGRLWMDSDVNVADGSSGGAAVDETGHLVGVPTFVGTPACGPGDTNSDGQVDEADYGCIPVGGYLVKLRPINMAKPLLDPIVEPTPKPDEIATTEPRGYCRSIAEGYLEENRTFGDKNASHILVGYWTPNGPDQKERTVILAGGIWQRDVGVGGYFWVFADCTDKEVEIQAIGHNERQAQKLGERFAGWGDETYFTRLE